MGRAAARVALGKREQAPVYFDEIDKITQLVITSDATVDLTDLSGLPSLQKVDLTGGTRADYSPLLLCDALNELYVGDVDYAANIDVLEQLQEKDRKERHRRRRPVLGA